MWTCQFVNLNPAFFYKIVAQYQSETDYQCSGTTPPDGSSDGGIANWNEDRRACFVKPLNKLELHFVYEGVQSRPFSLNYVVKNEILDKISLLFKNKVLHLQLID